MTAEKNISTSELLHLIDFQRKSGESVKLHPNGFLQLSLSPGIGWREEGLRFHVWADGLPQKPYQIHNHIFDIRSQVLIGNLKNTFYDIKEDQSGDFVLIEADIRNITSSNRFAKCIEKNSHVTRQGEEYSLDKDEFHTSTPESPLVATVMRKFNVNNSVKPIVIFPKNFTEEDLHVSRDVDQKFAWSIIDKVLEQIK